jgi:osmotically-inducible protein OsmY
MTDKAAILERVRQAFASEPRIGPGFRPARLDIDDEGILLVDGEVDSVPAKKLVLEHAAALRGVSGVLDRVRVKPASAMGDDEIRAHLLNACSQEPAFLALELRERSGDSVVPVRGGGASPLGAIEYEVDDGVVTLNGDVPGLDSKRLAGLLAWWVPGTRDVINGLVPAGGETDDAGAIQEAVRIALDKDPFVNAGQVRIGVRHRTVHLTGLVRSGAERDMAEKDAWYVFGVDKVINDIDVAP